MKKMTIALIGAAILSSTSSYAYAQDKGIGGLNPYVALDAQYLSGDVASGLGIEEDYGAVNFGVGIRPHKNFGFEAGYFVSGERDIQGTALNSSLEGFSADVIGYLPVSKDEKFELLGSVGLAITTAELRSGAVSVSDTETNVRLGVGAQYHMTDNWAARARFIFTNADFDGVVDSFSTFGVGVAYKF